MSIIVKILAPVAVRIVRAVVRKSTPEIRKEIEDFVLKWEQKARATPNKWDDILVELVKGILLMKKGKSK